MFCYGDGHVDYSADPQKRVSQYESVAHIEVQRLIDHHEDLQVGSHIPPSAEAFPLLREALLTGEVARGRTGEITGYGERMARNVVSVLLKQGYLKSKSSRAPLVLAFPIDAVERWFPKLYPATSLGFPVE